VKINRDAQDILISFTLRSTDQMHFSESHSLRTYHARKPCKAQPAEKFRYNAQPPAHWGMERITVCILVIDPYRRHRIMHHSNP
jgi:hypothetical protein